MAGDGPTTAGSIVGKMKMDRSDWERGMAATFADMRALEAGDTRIDLNSNAKDVIADLDDVAAATETVTQKSQEHEQQTRRTTSETIKANEANRTHVTRLGMITTAVAVLLPLLAPVAAGAIGIGAAFLGMGAAGVFALVGINREMDQGTELGKQYAEGVTSMKGALSQLSSTAALNMLSSFRRVVAETNDDLPFLNQQVGTFSQLLGRSGANFFTGILTSLRVLNPLMMTAAVWVEHLSVGFERWTSNGGLERFASYALGALPQVVDLLGALGTMVMHVLQALAPLGAIGMAVLTGVANAISSIPVELLGTLIGMITWGAIAFKAWGFIAPMLSGVAAAMGAVGVATTIATGPIGWIIAGVAALASIFVLATASQQGATAAMRDYTTAVQADNGAVGENVRLKAAQKLQESGVLATAKLLKVSVEDVTNATLGNSEALARVNERLDEYYGKQDAAGTISKVSAQEVDLLRDAIAGNALGIKGAVDAQAELDAATGKATVQTEYQRNALETAAAAAGVSVEAYSAVDQSQGDMASQTEKATAQMYLQNDAAGLLKQALDLLNGKQIDAAQAQNQFEQQLVNLPDYLDEATGALDTAGASLSGMSDTAVTNRGSLLGLIESSQVSAQAFRDQGLSAEETRAKMLEQRQAIIDNAVANGMNRDEVTRYVEELYKVPASLPPTQLEVNTEHAKAQVAAFIANVNSRIATIQVRATMPDLNGAVSGSGRPGVAMGGTIPGLAGGGSGGTVFGPGTAGSDTAGLFRLANREEITSNVFGQADRHRGLLKQINAGVVAPTLPAGVARGMDAGTVQAPGQQGVTHIHHWHVTSHDGMQLSQQFANRQNQLGG
ncbi:hypothetical protein [Agromyces ramosus]|uniref:Polyhydroxyalkanoate synthesis regulator phasin/flagellar hook-basal body complex protein FliE n=1 Tax=Agromyces ramosus TaxID=33879 RepID=A0ABU0R8M0_9MICO|nr:hypothetical protein [Agromyces ramosus]MDQ0894422.1 polyhydroxyalkanoate synthesis regulator phasin/flagellar hook-basal body complex protein FliE [Agromyces ramosus]